MRKRAGSTPTFSKTNMTDRIAQLFYERTGLFVSDFGSLILDGIPSPLCKLKGGWNETTELYERLSNKQGIYFILKTPKLEDVVYIGRTSDGKKERGLADRLWGDLSSCSTVRRRLQEKKIILDDCFVVALEVSDFNRRIQLEHLAIGIFTPIGNVG